MPTRAAARAVAFDPTVYPSTDNMGDPTLQVSIAVMLLGLLEGWVASRGKPAFVGMNTFFYWKQHDPSETVAPDVYVLPGVSLVERPPSWKVWETGKAPSFAIEIVSTDVDKDYRVAPEKYGRLGVREVVVFDPYHRQSRERLRWQVFRRLPRRGLVRVEVSNGDRVLSRVLGCWLVAVGHGDQVRVRLGVGPEGKVLVLTAEEARDKERAERERAEAERDKERAGRERAEAELALLRAQLGRRTPRGKRKA